MNIDKVVIQKKFIDYVASFPVHDEAVQLKLIHSFRVSQLCCQIAHSLSFGDRDVHLAWLIGLLHDLGRFEQLHKFHTFIDGRSMDHALYGASYLFNEGHIRDFLEDSSEDMLICKAIELHSVYALPDDLTPRQRGFCRLLRDADKIDIFRVYATHSLSQNPTLPLCREDFENSIISSKVMAVARTQRTIETKYKKTPLDFYVGMLCLYFGLEFSFSKKIVSKQGFLKKLMTVRPTNPETMRQIQEVYVLLGIT